MTSSLKSKALNLYNSAGVRKYQTLVTDTDVSIKTDCLPLLLQSKSINLQSGCEKINDLVGFLKTIQTSQTSNNTSVNSLTTQLNNLNSSVSTNFNTLNTDFSNLQSVVANNYTSVNTNIANASLAQSQALTNYNSLQTTAISGLQTQIDGINVLVNNDPTVVAQIQQVIAMVNSADSSILATITDLTSRLASVEGKYDNLSNDQPIVDNCGCECIPGGTYTYARPDGDTDICIVTVDANLITATCATQDWGVTSGPRDGFNVTLWGDVAGVYDPLTNILSFNNGTFWTYQQPVV